MPLPLGQSSALNLELQGSVGSFRVGRSAGETPSIEVKYFLTHVGLDFTSGTSAQVLSHLAPVRELFGATELEFDEIMQRDIDDARVSSELIPYLLDAKSRDLVKLFPPIIVVVLPTQADSNHPASLYPKVSSAEVPYPDGYTRAVVRSGAVGQEVFEFVQPIQEGSVLEHDLARLRLNTTRCKLVIVDGQHRAMALLAIYRNLKEEWTDQRRAPFKDYYEEWTPNYIRQFELDKISVPVMFCTFPRLDVDYLGDYDLKKAARSIFLTLNKTARRVSESRNRLLDDSDLVALCLRGVLSSIKQKDLRSAHSLRISNIELDQMHDRIRIDTPIAISGVNHIYYLIEHLLFNEGDKDVNGARPRGGKFYKRMDLGAYNVMTRLDGRNALGAEVADATTRSYFTTESGQILERQFAARRGRWIVSLLERLGPMESHNRASLWLDEYLASQENQRLRPILFEGQGISRVFDAHREILREKHRAREYGPDATRIGELVRRLDATAQLVRSAVDRFRNERAKNFLLAVAEKRPLRIADRDDEFHPKLVAFINEMYDNVFTSVAFQTACVATFFGEMERANARQVAGGEPEIDTEAAFDGFIAALNDFFVPRSWARLKNLIEVFAGVIDGDATDWRIVKSPFTFREVVYPGEMQPDQWPKYRYLVLELWRPSTSALAACVDGERDKCRSQVFAWSKERVRDEYLKANLRREEDLTSEERTGFDEQAHRALTSLLGNLGWAKKDLPGVKALLRVSELRAGDTDSATVPDQDQWTSADAEPQGASASECPEPGAEP